MAYVVMAFCSSGLCRAEMEVVPLLCRAECGAGRIYIVMAYAVMAYIVMAFVVLGSVVMGYVVMAYVAMVLYSYGLCSYGLCSSGLCRAEMEVVPLPHRAECGAGRIYIVMACIVMAYMVIN